MAADRMRRHICRFKIANRSIGMSRSIIYGNNGFIWHLLFLECLKLWDRRLVRPLAVQLSSLVGPFNDNVLLTQRDGFTMLLCGAHASQMDFFLQNKPTLDDKDFFNDRNDRDVALFSNRWSGIHRQTDRDMRDLDVLLRQRFIDQMRMIAGADMHMNGSLDLVARNRDLFAVERKNLFFNSMRLLGRIRMSGCRNGLRLIRCWADQSSTASRTLSLAPPTAFWTLPVVFCAAPSASVLVSPVIFPTASLMEPETCLPMPLTRSLSILLLSHCDGSLHLTTRSKRRDTAAE